MRSRHRYRRRRAHQVARNVQREDAPLRGVVDVVVLDGTCAPRGPPTARLDLVRSVGTHTRRMASRTRSATLRPDRSATRTQGLQLFVAQIDLRLDHRCHSNVVFDTRQRLRPELAPLSRINAVPAESSRDVRTAESRGPDVRSTSRSPITRPRVKLILNHDVVARSAAWRGRPDIESRRRSAS